MIDKSEEFELANDAFDLMTLQERGLVLTIFAKLQYPLITDRFTEAVYRVVKTTRASGLTDERAEE